MAVCGRDSWMIGFTHCEPYYECTLDMDCDDDDPCTSDACIMRWCTYGAVDEDEDGHTASQVDGVVCGGDDCDDAATDVHPGVDDDECDFIDKDCDGSNREHIDDDGDEWIDAICDGVISDPGALVGLGDCDDLDEDVHPGAVEVCLDGTDQDCDGLVDGLMSVVPETRFTDASGGRGEPGIVWSGSEFGLVWGGDSRSVTERHVFFSRLSPAGTKIGGDIAVSTSGSDYGPAIAWTGSEYAVVWTFYSSGNSILYLGRVSATGSKTGSDVRVTSESSTTSGPSIVWTGSEVCIAWTDSRSGVESEIYIGRFTPDGAKIGSDVLVEILPAHEVMGDIAWSGSEIGLVWTDYRSTTMDVRFVRLSPAGTKSGPELAVTDSETVHSAAPSITWSGSEYGITWIRSLDDDVTGHYETTFGRITADGARIGSDLEVSVAPADFAAAMLDIAWVGSVYGLTWYDDWSSIPEIWLALVSSAGALEGVPVRVSSDDGETSAMSELASTGTGFGFTWRDDRHTGSEIYTSIHGFCD